MRFGVFYVVESPDGDFKRAYDEMLDQIEYAEYLGFDTVWLAEHHGSSYGSLPSPQVMAAAVAERTKYMRIGLAVSILPFDNPVRIAEDYAMVDLISGGRLDFGVGRGYQPREFGMLGLEDAQGDSRGIFEESLDIILGLWTEDRFTYQGRHFQIEDAELHPRPLQKPHPPVYVAAISPETFDLVAEKGFNLLVTPTLMDLRTLKSFTLDAKKRLVERGRDPHSLDFPLNWQIHLARTAAEAKERTRDAFGWYFDKVMSVVPQGGDIPATYEAYGAMARAYADAGGFPIERLQELGVLILGTPEDAIARIEEVYRDIGQQHISCWFRIGGLEDAKVRDSMKLFAEEVMPRFRDRPMLIPDEIAAPDGDAALSGSINRDETSIGEEI
ncbi:MAG TPA: LLM class flavin-dependent oxidoreductase [Solirubrobacterales bacterium]|nr:LLM class flavin-dependent oxidoreductase [Solirubrobacterales bacterium]